MTYDVSLDARPLSLTMLSRSYPNPMRGEMSGPIRAQGQSPDLQLTTTLAGEAGTFSFDGRVDLDSVGGFGARGHGQFSALSPSTLLAKADGPKGALSGHYDVDLNAQTVSDIRGSGDVAIERTSFDGVSVYPSRAHLTFGDGRMRIDSLRLETAAGMLEASGAIGLPKAAASSDSLAFTFNVDSLGGLRRFIASADTAAPEDSLSGQITVKGFAKGRLDSFGLSGTLTGNSLYFARNKSDAVRLDFEIANAPDSASGRLTLSVDTATVG